MSESRDRILARVREALDGRERQGVLIVEVEGVPDTLLAKVRISR